MSDFWKFASDSPYIAFFLTALACEVVKVAIFILPNRLMRHWNIRKHGYPPPHCDADGDFRLEISKTDMLQFKSSSQPTRHELPMCVENRDGTADWVKAPVTRPAECDGAIMTSVIAKAIKDALAEYQCDPERVRWPGALGPSSTNDVK